jgi:3-oxoacyl-[acyl-carrier protein] reductase
MSNALDGRFALVTGAASGIGRGVATYLAELGHPVAVLDRDGPGGEAVAGEIVSSGGRAIAVAADVAVEGEVLAAVRRVEDELGEVAVLVNNAGFARDSSAVDMATDDWDDVLATHLRGSFLLARAVLPSMQRAGWGRIVNISSISALAHAGRANYVAAKAGLEGLTRALAHEVAGDGITVNAVGPGVVVTGMTERGALRLGRTLEEHVEILRQTVPVGRVGTPHDIARAVAFFTAEDADFVTGQVIYVSGGPHG